MGSTTATSAFQKTLNPWGTNRIPGGSSWGSAAAVAAWLAPASLWTDTWGSIRQPASVCWIVGFKPSYWRNSRFWVNAMASSLDTPWTLTKTVKDAALLYEISNWEDPKENTSIPWKDIINPKIWETKDFSWVKVWVPKEYFEEWLDAWVKEVIEKAIEDMKNAWAEIVEISLPMTKYAIATYYILMPAEVSTNLSRLDWIRYWHTSKKPYSNMDELFMNNREEGFWDEVKRRIILWSYVLSAGYYDAYYTKAAKVRTLIIEDFKKAFEKCDVIVGPVSPSVAWELWEKSDDPLKMYLSDAYTIPASLAWLPAMSVPAWYAKSEDWKNEELPVWLHLITPQFEEQKLFEIAHVYEQLTKHYKMPEGFED
jgi:aspartyl-tRNA(Asn)/glutamyl-tRNA(Gln) amidotransferase subunit A